ncbi:MULTISPECIES: hypothetical protein [Bacillus]|uniref:hypothetical protein n=1 Tax=Bacillus TaxID=1386 RepID=UPI0006F79E87|nr:MULTISPECIES: hypothetical protein [Bacillus]KQU09013.1 hypothetical protein ASG46_14875 [Bacillus sp. Leaf49]MCY7622033.1 hypothetical protein [Bacillus altitudinis]MED0852388.1 hypothetical protein [Bacillus altitudinis]WEZ69891.1 hypothetical protein P5623_11720 [Bacillus altitudinis]
MKNIIKVVNKFIFETAIILLPFTIVYLLLGNWLSGITDFGRTYVFSSDVTNLREVYGTGVKYGWIEFDTFGQGFKNYSFNVSYVFWGGLVSAILLVLIGKLIHVVLVKLLVNRVNIKNRT